MSSNTSAILWFVWSIGVCAFAVLVAAHLGAFDIVESHTEDPILKQTQDSVLDTFQSFATEQPRDEIIEFVDGSTIRINNSQRQHMACILRFGLWC